MKEKLTPKTAVTVVTGILFAVYAAYNIFIIFKDRSALSSKAILISALVALIFLIFAGFMLTAGVKTKNIRFVKIRGAVFMIALAAVFLLKLNRIRSMIAYLDFSSLTTVWFDLTYFMTLIAMLLLFIYYTFILKRYPLYPKAAVALPTTAMVLFLLSLVIELVLFIAFGIISEASPLRTAVIRPVFYLGFAGMSAYFLFPPEAVQTNLRKTF